MAIAPFANWRPIPETLTQPKITPRAIVLHTAVDAPGPSSLFGFFRRSDVHVESHFFVKNDGTIEQYVDTARRADAQRYANPFAISIETEDDGDPTQNWTPEQVKALVLLCRWLCNVHGIPDRQIEKWDGSGIGWHSMWGAPSKWTPSRGKTCPGPARIRQAPWIILAVRKHRPPISAARTQVQVAPKEHVLAQLAAAIDAASKTTVRRGSKGDAVKWVQALLTRAGLPTAVDGVFGRNTENLVKLFQARHRLAADGIVGPATWAVLKEGR